MAAYWNVPYIGQVGEGANEHGNDCGPACVSMILRWAGITPPPIDALYDEVKPSGDSYTSFGDLMGLLSRRGLDPDYEAGVETKDLYWILRLGVPVIALVSYGVLATIRPNKFAGNHFVVVIGMDLDTVYIHDPLNTPTPGDLVAVPIGLFEKAWSTAYQSIRSIIVPAKSGSSIVAPVTKTVYPRDKDGCNVRSTPGLTDILYAIPYGTRMTVYEESNGWGRIHSTKQEWVCLEFTK